MRSMQRWSDEDDAVSETVDDIISKTSHLATCPRKNRLCRFPNPEMVNLLEKAAQKKALNGGDETPKRPTKAVVVADAEIPTALKDEVSVKGDSKNEIPDSEEDTDFEVDEDEVSQSNSMSVSRYYYHTLTTKLILWAIQLR